MCDLENLKSKSECGVLSVTKVSIERFKHRNLSGWEGGLVPALALSFHPSNLERGQARLPNLETATLSDRS